MNTPKDLTSAVTAYAVVGFGEEADLLDATALDHIHDAPDGLVAGFLVAADVYFRLRLLAGGGLHIRQQVVTIGDGLVVPVDVAVLVDGDRDVLGLGLRRDVDGLGQIDLHGLVDDRDRDQGDDEQHQHHVHQRGGVDARNRSRLPAG